MMLGYVLLITLLGWISITQSTYTLKVVTNPSNCRGGEACETQPQIAILNNGDFDVTFEGYVSVVMGSSPSGSETLYIGSSCDDEDNCGIAVSGTIARAYFDNSIAVFQDLLIKTAGTDYTLSFIAYDNNDELATVVESSKPFSVTSGSMYKLIFSTFIGAATGGLPFNPNPIIAVADRGSNILTSINGYYVTASIKSSPTGKEKLLPTDKLRVSIIDGIAAFSGLYINEAGYPYSLAFTSNLNLPTLVSASFVVSVGTPSSLAFVNGTELSSSTIYAGEFLQTTPRIQILDAGGNLVSSDSSSGMKIAILDNPSAGTLSPSENLFITANQGLFSVSTVKIDKVGLYYRLSFTFYDYDSLANTFTESDIVLNSEKFNIVTGPPRGLEFTQLGSNAWGGGSPMEYQPNLKVVDYGGNTILTDFSSELVASMIPSLSASATISIDSSTTITTTIKSITTENSAGFYTYSDTLVFALEFTDEIWVYGDNLPQLELNIVQQSGAFAKANLTGEVERTKFLYFTYTINLGDGIGGVDYRALDSLLLNGATILDATNANVSTILPSVGLFSTNYMVVNCEPPRPISFDLMSSDGVYTVGDKISFSVTFNYPIVVKGTPYLNVTLYGESALAYYTHGDSDNTTIVFTYAVDYGHNVDKLDFSSSSIGVDDSSSILRLSVISNITADYRFFSLGTDLMAAHNISIDTTVPVLNATYGVQSNLTDGTYYVGDEITLFIQFTYPVVIGANGITLELNCGNEITGYAMYERLLDDGVTLAFVYTVEGGVNTSALDIKSGKALTLSGDDTYIRRVATVPTMNVNLSTSVIYTRAGNAKSLQDYVHLELYGYYAVITNINVSSVHRADASQAVLFPDDYVLFDVTFDIDVVVSCIPVFLISVGTEREAQYISGSGTDTLTFKYIVSPGDISDSIGYDFVSSLCVTSGCPAQSDECYIRTKSVNRPILDANLNIPGAVDYSFTVMPGGNYAVMPNLVSRNTTIASIEATNDDGVYGPGTNVFWDVTFTDEVMMDAEITDTTYPTLYLNTGKYALYTGGIGTKVLQFIYTTSLEDDVERLLPQFIPDANVSTPFRCFYSESCGLINFALQPVDLNTSVITLSNITADNTPPSILDVWTEKVTSPYNGYYTVGEEILIYVKYNAPVVIVGSKPRLKMDVGVDDVYGKYSLDLSTDTILAFIYTVASGATSEDLSYTAGLLDSAYGLSLIYRQADIPTLLANYSLPDGTRAISRNGEIVRINTIDVPLIVEVTGYSPDGDYKIADTIIFEVVFSQYVVLTSNAYINLNLGNDVGVARYCGFNQSNLDAELPTAATLSLFFKYVVGENHFSVDLDCVDRYSLFLGVTTIGGAGSMLQAATTPTVNAVLDLPSPGAAHSLSYNSDFYVDGNNVYLTDIAFVTPSGTYGLYDTIVIRMNFTGPVVVVTDEGVPYISMEAGDYDRKALYASGSTTNVLLFNYIVEKGDMNELLDYAVEKEFFNTARYCFQLNGGKIFVNSTDSSNGLEVPVRLNPIQGYLSGDRYVTAISGGYTYIDLSVSDMGLDYSMRFNVDNTKEYPNTRTLTTTQDLFVSFSGEFSLRPNERIRSNLIGWDVAIDGDLSLIGAPNSNLTVTAIQAVSSYGSHATPVCEIQLISTDVELQPVIQEFHTTAGVNEVVGGTFTISYYSQSIQFGPTRLIPANVDERLLESILNYDLSVLGKVTVKRTPYIYCACENAFTWQITFDDITSGVTDSLIFDSSGLIGVNASVQGPFIKQQAAYLDGTFALTFGDKTSSYINYDATAVEMVAAIQELGLETVDVSIGVTDSRRCRTWTITFDAYQDWYEIPLLGSISSKLTGGTTSIWHRTVREGVHGPTGLAGGFTLEFRGNTTAFIPYNASAVDVKKALEDLDTIHEVNVFRSEPSSINEYTWQIEFVEVYTYTNRGLVLDFNNNVETIIAHNYLIGTDASLVVQSIFGPDSRKDVNNYQVIRQGSYGVQAGAAYVYQYISGGWSQVAKLVGNDTNEYDQFGTSVQVDNANNLIVVGAVGADIVGVPEKQAIYCSATEGYFALRFRGWTSSQISYNVSRTELHDHIVSDMTSFDKGLYGINFISIADWGSGNLCRNNTAVITFYNPVDGDSLLFNSYSDLELLEVVDNTLQGNITVTQVQKGTIRPHGVTSDVQQTGAVYVFRGNQSCANSLVICDKSLWIQEAKFAPLKAVGGEQFGFSVAITDDIVAVGAPGGNVGKGSVYVYEYTSNNGGQWDMLQLIQVNELDIGSNLGYSVAVDGRTLVIGAPGANNGVYIYKRPVSGGEYSAAQLLFPTKTLYPLSYGDRFGHSLAIDGDNIVVSASEWSGNNIYLGTEEVESSVSGAVFLFSRASIDYDYEFNYKLVPSNVKRNDRFGYDVDIKDDIVVVGAVQNYDGEWTPSKAVIEVKTVATYNAISLGGYFKLKWMSYNASEYHFTSIYATSDSTTSDGGLTMQTSREIPHDASAAVLQNILEEDLNTGSLLVSRSSVDAFDGGYSWSITFLEGSTNVNLFEADVSSLTGSDATVEISYINPAPPSVRSTVHVFKRQDSSANFIEQIFLSPFSSQPFDLCGWSLRVTTGRAIVGCPNRDDVVPDFNVGAALIYDLSLLNIKFSDDHLYVAEGLTVNITVDRSYQNTSESIYFYVETLDRNAPSARQEYIEILYGIVDGELPYPLTTIDVAEIAGDAVARSQYYGSQHNESVWIDGMYDYRGISDYVPILSPYVMIETKDNVTIELITTPDSILELNDETVTLAIHAPGIWPSILGDLHSTVTIEDDGDGYADGSNQYDKIYGLTEQEGVHLGHSLYIDDDMGVLFAGIPLQDVNSLSNAGCVIFYRSIFDQWLSQKLMQSPTPVSSGKYGDEVVVQQISKTTGALVIGEPGVNKVHVYFSYVADGLGKNWTYDATLSVAEATSSQDLFGSKGTIALYGHLLVVGAPGLEKIFHFTRRYDNTTASWVWSEGVSLVSSDYDYDMIHSKVQLHRQQFGKAVALSSRTIAVGAPYADYNKLGSDLVEANWNTEGSDIFGYGRGKVYVFYSSPPIATIVINALTQLSEGTFVLSYDHNGVVDVTSEIEYSATTAELTTLLSDLSNVESIEVSKSNGPLASGGYQYTWTVTFLSEWDSLGKLTPLWRNDLNESYNCSICAPFDSSWSVPSEQVTVTFTEGIGAITQHQSIEASDKRSGNKFGWTIALQNDQLAVGAIHSNTITSTSWDFEAGYLKGWSKTGDAFDYQPTYGDNSYYRPVDPGTNVLTRLKPNVQRTRMVGLYYIGTYEKRPGDSSNYMIAGDYAAGSYQGDGPTGTLTSDVFIIKGTRITFLIGGGCARDTEYVELLIDGLGTSKHTGKCSERMDKVYFDVSNYYNRAAQIRIVDASTATWGHINVDDFRFDWDIEGSVYSGVNQKTTHNGVVESPRSGAVYTFIRQADGSDQFCTGNKFLCVWEEEARLVASDKRANTFFGSSIALNDEAGVLVIGSPYTSFTGFYKETPSVYPYINETSGLSNAAGITFPVSMSYMPLFQSDPLYGEIANAGKGVWELRTLNYVNENTRMADKGGAVYVFIKEHAIVDSNGNVISPQHWYPTEHSKIQPPDEVAYDMFGTHVSLSGSVIAVGSVGNDGHAKDGGAIYTYNAIFAALSFSAVEYPVLEGTSSYASVTILRNKDIFDGEVYIEYATSDLSAQGVDSTKFTACMGLATNERGPAGCGDYEQTKGVLRLAAGSVSGGFDVRIMNDLCKERFMKYIQVTISVPGSAALQGEAVSCKIRIDDDDYLLDPC